MMKANKKYTLRELLKAAGVKSPEKKFGKVGIRVAGLTGFTSLDHLITIQPKVKSIRVAVGGGKNMFVGKVDFNQVAEKREVTDEAKKVLKVKGAESSKKAKVIQKAKAKARAKA